MGVSRSSPERGGEPLREDAGVEGPVGSLALQHPTGPSTTSWSPSPFRGGSSHCHFKNPSFLTKLRVKQGISPTTPARQTGQS